MPFTANDLTFRDYHTGTTYESADPRISGALDLTRFDRTEREEVLFFINACYEAWSWPEYTKGPGRKVERLLRTYLPGGNWTQAEILDWIRDNWRHYWNLLPGH